MLILNEKELHTLWHPVLYTTETKKKIVQILLIFDHTTPTYLYMYPLVTI